MIGNYKPFDQSLSDQCDTPGRAFVKMAAKAKWNVVAEDYEKYKVDLICKRGGKVIGYAEVEMRNNFFSEFPFDTIHVPSRKDKLMNNGLPTVYFVVNKPLTKLLWVRTDKVVDYPLVEVPNKMVPKGEFFYDVPKDQFTEVVVCD